MNTHFCTFQCDGKTRTLKGTFEEINELVHFMRHVSLLKRENISDPLALRKENEMTLNEPELPDDYPVYGDYMYVADGKLIRSDWHGINVREFKHKIGAKVVCRCDIIVRARAAGRDVS